MNATIKTALLLTCLAATATEGRAQAVLVVDSAGGAGADYTSLPTAVEAALDGDVLLLRSGTYDPLVISGKGLTVTADRGATVTISETLHVDNLVPGQSVLLNGLDVDATDVSYAGTILDNLGPVLVTNCSFDGSGGPLVSGGLFVASCASVAFVDTSSIPTLTAGATVGRPALLTYDSAVYAYGCNFVGSDGLETLLGPIPGADGANVVDAFLFAAGCVLEGGDGGNGNFGFAGCTDGGDGGNGVRVVGAGAEAQLLANTATGGSAGNSGGPGCVGGVTGLPVRTQGGTSTALTGIHRTHLNDSPVREGQDLQSTYTGVEDELVVSVVALGQDVATFFPASLGASHLLVAGSFLQARGAVQADGTLASSVTIPELGMGIESFSLVEQPLFLDPTTMGVVIGDPKAIVLLDDSL